MEEVKTYKTSNSKLFENKSDAIKEELSQIFDKKQTDLILKNIDSLRTILETEKVVEKIIYRERNIINYPYTRDNLWPLFGDRWTCSGGALTGALNVAKTDSI